MKLSDWQEITELSSFPLENIEIVEGDSAPPKTKNFNNKSNRVREIGNQLIIKNRDLSGADLSGTNLIGANLSSANLIGAYLRNADLKGAKINENTQFDLKWRKVWEIVNQGASGANLNEADLRNADLSGATLLFLENRYKTSIY